MTAAAEFRLPDGQGRALEDLAAVLAAGRPLIDVRAPVEFQQGAFPSAINLPLLDDQERRLVGIRYKEKGQDAAIALGRELLDPDKRRARRDAWLACAANNEGAIVLCFRGGLRSQLAQQWLADAGVVLPRVAGGYKALRQLALDTLEQSLRFANLLLVGGRTGVGKTAFIARLGERVAHIDLEALAEHRGSSFGGTERLQPANATFENALASDWLAIRAAGKHRLPLVLEDEARMIGRVAMPVSLKTAMDTAPLVILDAPLDQRVSICLGDYVHDLLARFQQRDGHEAGFEAYARHHREALERIRKRLGGARHKEAVVLLDAALLAHRSTGDTALYRPFIASLLEHYYDPMYDYQIAGKRDRILARGSAESLLDKLPAILEQLQA